MSKSLPADQRPWHFPSGTKPKRGAGSAVLGEKGHMLAELVRAGAPVPPGTVLPTGLCAGALRVAVPGGASLDAGTERALAEALEHLAKATGRTFGAAKRPLLLSVRSSPPYHLPRYPEAVVNVGLTEATVGALAKEWNDERAAWDAYRRLIHSYALTVLNLEAEGLDALQGEALDAAGVESDHDLSAEAMGALALALREHCVKQTGADWLDDPQMQLRAATAAGFLAWNREIAVDYRLQNGLEDEPGMAVVLQAMSGGTTGVACGSGTLSTRSNATGEKTLQVRFMESALGMDLTAGGRIPDGEDALKNLDAGVHGSLLKWAATLEAHFADALLIQFSLAGGELALLSARPLQRTPRASLHIALDLVDEGLCSQEQGLLRIMPRVVDEYLHPVLDKTTAPAVLCKGLPASPGSAVGRAVFFAEHAVELAGQGIPSILIRHETTPEDIDGLKVAEGIVTMHGGLTSHAAVVARGMGKCCIVGVPNIAINYHISEMTVNGTVVQRNDWVSIDGNTGEIYAAQLPQVQPTLEGGIARVLEWADKARTMGVYANADTAEDAKRAVELGAGGIGLCRTEHMFFHMDRIPLFRKMILSPNEVGRSAALAELLPLQRRDFMDIFRVMDGKPVTIRLLDPPLNEFLPRGIRSQTRMSRAMGMTVEQIQQRTEALTENNPMMGHRGCRLAITYPEIYNTQVRAIVEAACIVRKEGIVVMPEIMVPLVSTQRELSFLRRDIEKMMHRVLDEMGEAVDIKIGTMIETPRAAVCSRSIASHADFFSFGTNDLTQMAFGFSRDDAGMFLPTYLERQVLDADPFVELDRTGTGRLMQISVEEGRRGNPNLKLGICGEHGGEPASVKFCHQVGLDYVSCSPFRLPVARLAAGQAAVESRSGEAP